MESTFHRKKFYVPKKIIDELELRDEDKVEFRLLGSDAVELKIERKRSSKQILLDEISNPGSLGIKKRALKRKDYYEDSIDTNFVVYAHDRDSPKYPESSKACSPFRTSVNSTVF